MKIIFNPLCQLGSFICFVVKQATFQWYYKHFMMLFERQKPINDNDSLSITPWNDKKNTYSIWLLSRCLVRREGNKIKLLMLTTHHSETKKNWIYFKRLFKAHTLIYFRLFYRMHITIIYTHKHYARLSAKLNSFYDDWKLNTIIHQIVNSYCAMSKSPIQLYCIWCPPSTYKKG